MLPEAAQSNTFRAKIRSLLEERCWTQEQLARRANLTLSAVSSLLCGRVEDPKLSTVKSLADAFGVTLAELLGEIPS